MKNLQTREQKIKYLKDLESGKASVNDIAEPISGSIFTQPGEGGKTYVFLYTSKEGSKTFPEPGIEVNEFKKLYSKGFSHELQFENFSNPKI